MNNTLEFSYFEKPVKVQEGVWHIGRVHTNDGRFIRNLSFFGNMPKDWQPPANQPAPQGA